MDLGQIRQLMELRRNHQELSSAWYRQLLTLAAGGLALLVGLQPPAAGIGRYFLAGTWVCLGAGICLAAAATYLDVHRAKMLADSFRAQVSQALAAGRDLSPSDIAVARPKRFYTWSRYLTVSVLLLAVGCLVTYAVLATLAV